MSNLYSNVIYLVAATKDELTEYWIAATDAQSLALAITECVRILSEEIDAISRKWTYGQVPIEPAASGQARLTI